MLECLQRSLRIVDACGESNTEASDSSTSLIQVPLFLNILEAVRLQ